MAACALPGFYPATGSLKSRTTVRLLFAAISFAYGGGDGEQPPHCPIAAGHSDHRRAATGRRPTIPNTMGATGGVDKYSADSLPSWRRLRTLGVDSYSWDTIDCTRYV